MSGVEISEQFVKEHVDKWVTVWNSRNLKTLLDMYRDDIEFASPRIKAVFPDRKESTVSGKTELERYWSAALKKYEKLHFAPVSLMIKGNQCLFEYIGTYNSARQRVVEKFEFSPDGQVARAGAFYGAEL